MLSVCSIFQRLNQSTDFREIWYGHCTAGCSLNLILSDFLQLVTAVCRTLELRLYTRRTDTSAA